MKKLFSIASLCAAVVIAIGVAAPAAKAITITSTFTGTIRDGADYGGDFGAFGTGSAVTLKTVFDTTTGTFAGNKITGGGALTLTINGVDKDFSLTPSSYALDGYGSIKVFAGDVIGSFLSTSFYSPTLPGSIFQPFDGDCYNTAGGYCSGSFQIVPGYTGASMDFDHLNVAISNTPIPAALPLFASALLGLGAIGWRRKATMSA